MGPSDAGMFDWRTIDDPVTVGNGKVLRAGKIGKVTKTAHQINGETLDLTLMDYKQVPGLKAHLFSITKALDAGWMISNVGVKISLNKGDSRIVFDRVLKTDSGKLCAVELLPRMETELANPAVTDVGEDPKEKTVTWEINRMHKVYNHASEDVLRATANSYGWKIIGKFEACKDCQTSNIQQKGVSKSTETKSTIPGERIFFDISSIKTPSYGGNRFWLIALDDATSMTWSKFLKAKKELPKKMMSFLHKMIKRGTPVKFLRCDNAGENVKLRDLCQADKDLTAIVFEFTPKDSPQFNGRAERKLAVLYRRIRANNSAAGLEEGMKLTAKLFAENAMNCTDKENLLISRIQENTAYLAFFKQELPKAECFRQFGEVAIIKHSPSIKGKLTNRGVPVLYLGRAPDHSADTYRFLNLGTQKLIVSRDAIWMNKVYGEFKGEEYTAPDLTTVMPVSYEVKKSKKKSGEDPAQAQLQEAATQDVEEQPEAVETAENAPVTRRAARQAGVTFDIPSSDDNPAVQKALKKLSGMSVSNQSFGITERVKQASVEGNEPEVGRAVGFALEAVDTYTMIDRFGGEFEMLTGDLTFVSLDAENGCKYDELDPSQYKDVFEDVPTKFHDAWDHPEPFQRKKWREAIEKEFSKMDSKKVWKKVKRSTIPHGRRCVKHKWVFEIKRSGIFRARLVACGYSQVPGEDFGVDVFSPVASDVSFRIILICMILWRLEALIFDVETAFLLGDLKEEIFMDCPSGMDHEEDECLLLVKTLYGLVQSARRYFEAFKGVLLKLGFKQCPADHCLFMRNDHRGICIILCHVDDNWTCGSKAAIDSVIEELPKHGFTITVDRERKDYLSCDGGFSKDKKKAWVGQPHMMKKLEKNFRDEVKGLQMYRTAGTPGLGLVKPQSEEDKVDAEKQSRYRTGVGMLLYCIKHSRPDLANPIRELTKVMDGATGAAYKEMLRVIKHVLDTKTLGLKVYPILDEGGGTLKWVLIVYTDSDWAGDRDNRRSVSGSILFLNGVPICWRSKLQKTVSLSSAEAEFYACAEAVKEVPFIVQILLFLGITVELPVKVKVDNVGAIYMSQNNVSSSRTRHMDTRYRYVNELQDDGLIKLEFVRSAQNISDIATKNVTGEIRDAHVGKLVVDKADVEVSSLRD